MTVLSEKKLTARKDKDTEVSSKSSSSGSSVSSDSSAESFCSARSAFSSSASSFCSDSNTKAVYSTSPASIKPKNPSNLIPEVSANYTSRSEFTKKEESESSKEDESNTTKQPADSSESGSSKGKRRQHKPSPKKSRPKTGDQQIRSSASSSKISESHDANSCDEYEGSSFHNITQEELKEKERNFVKLMKRKGFRIKRMLEDGACLFRAVADQVYGDQEMHSVVRRHCMDYMVKNKDYFSHYITEEFNKYIERKSLSTTYGNHVEMQAISELYNRKIEIYCYDDEPMNSIRGGMYSDNEPIRLSYHRWVHYNSVVNPNKASVGVGLGLPGHVPGSAEELLMKESLQNSENAYLEQALVNDKIQSTDLEAITEAIESQVAHESYLQWLKDCNTVRMHVDSSVVSDEKTKNDDAQAPSQSDGFPMLPAYSEEDEGQSSLEEDLLEQVLAMSQMEFYEKRDSDSSNAKADCKDENKNSSR